VQSETYCASHTREVDTIGGSRVVAVLGGVDKGQEIIDRALAAKAACSKHAALDGKDVGQRVVDGVCASGDQLLTGTIITRSLTLRWTAPTTVRK
jgi:hypothetical protein